MPIYEAAGSLVIHFGAGDVLVSLGRNAEKNFEDEIVFVRDTPHEIGAVTQDFAGKQTDQIDAPVRLIFENAESLDVLVERLQTLRIGMTTKAASGKPSGPDTSHMPEQCRVLGY